MRRVTTRLEKAHGVALAQLQLLQKQQEKEEDAQQQQQQINQLLLKNAELEKTVKISRKSVITPTINPKP